MPFKNSLKGKKKHALQRICEKSHKIYLQFYIGLSNISSSEKLINTNFEHPSQINQCILGTSQ